MKPGTLVRLISDPGRRGITTGRSREGGNRIFWQITFSDVSQYVAEKQFEIIRDEIEDSLDLFRDGKFGRVRDLRGAITHIRLSGRLADLIYSMETTNTDFYPYQFKPVLNFLESPSRGILIADEVGLGKTIEAGLIWTELRSRYDARRLMVLCPAMLREKWKLELQRRFGITATIVDADDVLTTLKEYKAGNLNDYAIIGSLQGLRPNRGWEDAPDIVNRASSRLANFLSENAQEEPLLDLLIVDEAHYLRNAQSMTFRLGRLLRDVSDHVVLLSATPIHLKNEDLYHLLNLVDEDSFNQVHVFDDILQANAPLLKARDMVLNRKTDSDELRGQLEEAASHTLLRDNRQLQSILENFPEEGVLSDPSYKSELAHRLEGINLLGRAVTRTRKREVNEWRVIREAVPEVISLSTVEQNFYTRVTELVRQYCIEHDSHEGFLLVTPQRQISSSMPAALRAWQRRQIELDHTVYEDSGVDAGNGEEVGPLIQLILDNVKDLGDLKELWENDSKYERLVSELRTYLKNHPHEKIVVFAYFRPTLYYLEERLSIDGISSVVLVGGGNVDKYEVMERFKEPDGPSVLLASEVASEGVDLQFSRVLVNYDLPWNPMKVEQRIGRIDRIGQTSPKITIWNLFYSDTIDDRIYNRLYMRLGIFEYALGGMEAVLGEEIKKLTIDLLRANLSREQEEVRIEQTEQAISNLRREEQDLEENACSLIAHGEYILNQVRAARELGRWITGEDIWIYIRDFFSANYSGCEFRQLRPDELLFDVKLSEDARYDLERFMNEKHLIGQSKILYATNKPLRCQFKNQVPEGKTHEYEQVNQFHPLTRFVSGKIQSKIEGFELVNFPAISLRLNRKEIPSIEPYDYLFYVEKWVVKGVRDLEKMIYCARPASANSNFIEDAKAEQLVTCAAKNGIDWLEAGNEVEVNALLEIMQECIDFAEVSYDEFMDQVKNENDDRANLQEKTLLLHMERQKQKLYEVLRKHEENGNINMIAPTRGLIEKMETRVKDKLRGIEERRVLQHHRREVCLGIIRIE